MCTGTYTINNIGHEISSSLKQYFEQVRDKKDYKIITDCLEEEEWEDFNPEKITEKNTEEDEKINFLQLIEKEDEEQIYTNLSEKNKIEMRRKFIHAIKYADK